MTMENMGTISHHCLYNLTDTMTSSNAWKQYKATYFDWFMNIDQGYQT